MEKTVKQFIVDNNEDFLYIGVHNKPNKINVIYTELFIQTNNAIYVIPFSQELIPTNTIKQLIRCFKSNDVIPIVHSFHYETLLKF